MKKYFQTVGARLRKVRRGSVIFELVFLSLNDITLFRHAYEEGRIEKELREILSAALNDTGSLRDLKLNIDHREFVNAERLGMWIHAFFGFYHIIYRVKHHYKL